MKAIGPKLVIATHNDGKLREIRELLAPFGIECVGCNSCRQRRQRTGEWNHG